jgi:hypothetical protein
MNDKDMGEIPESRIMVIMERTMRGGMNKLVLNLAVVAGMAAISSCTKSDPNGTSTFNKDIVMSYALARAAEQKLPVIKNVVDGRVSTLEKNSPSLNPANFISRTYGGYGS